MLLYIICLVFINWTKEKKHTNVLKEILQFW